ncbi:hypothetical protein [Streptomyces sp. NPDC007088]|uniref:hypothetical protein n=1 Tax=Streptomyces sp. NPDC007088 TaxID=3364773 RepID=UPI00368DFB48
MAPNTPRTSGTALAAHNRALLTDFINRCTTVTTCQRSEESLLGILRDQMEATLAELEAPEEQHLSWTGEVSLPGKQPGPTVVRLTDSLGHAYALGLDEDLREALGLLLVEPSDPDEVAAENADYDEQDGPLLEDETAEALFSYLVSESEEWQSGAAHQIHARSEPEALDYLLAHGPLRPDETKTLVTAIRLLHPDRFGPAA